MSIKYNLTIQSYPFVNDMPPISEHPIVIVNNNTANSIRRKCNKSNSFRQISGAWQSQYSFKGKPAPSSYYGSNFLTIKSLNNTKPINTDRERTKIRTPRLAQRVVSRQPVGVRRKREKSVYENSKELYKVSYPCVQGCSNCVFSSCLGPVKVVISQYDTPKTPLLKEISDGNGKNVIPKSRRREFRGLVYDKDTHSLYPPLPRKYSNKNPTYRHKVFY
ncbi:hypothetical protein ACJMK2_042068 [Sinanodonta woodiana]|uniref:Uncharacterized protein n=1 Tax=Sinanodonta woodiana TaxID=1069815 RepID=A0ABD3W9G4_SINWO